MATGDGDDGDGGVGGAGGGDDGDNDDDDGVGGGDDGDIFVIIIMRRRGQCDPRAQAIILTAARLFVFFSDSDLFVEAGAGLAFAPVLAIFFLGPSWRSVGYLCSPQLGLDQGVITYCVQVG